MLSCFPVVADPSTVEQWRVPFPLAKRVAKLVSPLSFTCQSRSNSLNAYFSDLCLEGQNLSSHFAFSRACSVIFLFTICKWQDDFEKLYIMLWLFFLEGSSTTTDCLLDLTEETTTTLDKGDTDKKLIAFVASVMLIALLKQIKSGVHAGLLSS